jgi:putative transposase
MADVLVFEDLNIQGMIRRCKTKQDELGRFTKNGQSAKRALNRLIRDCSWGNLKSKVQSVAEKFGCIYLEVNPMYSSQQCSHCGHLEKENRKRERMLCLVCGWLCDADVNAGVNLGMKGLEILGISPSKLLRVPEKVTTKPEATGSRNREKSDSLEFEPSNPRQLTLFEWGEFQVTATQNP